MKSLWKVIICALALSLVECNELEKVMAHLELLEMDLADHSNNLSQAARDILLKKPNAYKYKYEVEKKFAEFSKKESEDLRTLYHIDGLNLGDDYRHRWRILEKIGDTELPAEQWAQLSKFALEAEQITNELKIPCEKIPCDKLPCVKNASENCIYTRSDVAEMLLKSHDSNYLRAVWSAAQEGFLSKAKYYPDTLKLINSVITENGFTSVETYWSNLVEYEEVYDTARNLWAQIEPLHKKINNFVRSRLEQYYRIPSNESIPVYLLGSERGLDLSLIAKKILPHRYLYDEINASLAHEEIGGRRSYEIAEKLSTSLGLKKVSSKFWMRSLFNMSCPGEYLLFCTDKYSQVFTCNKTGFTEFLDAHEHMMRATLNQIDYSTSIYHEFRFSIIDEALVQLSTILAIKSLPMNGLIPEEVILNSNETEQNEMTILLLQALRILPRLSYYYLADEFRLKQLETPSDNLIEKWWEYREKYQFVRGVTNKEWDLLGDEYMRRNKPYIGKFLGTILQFQILNHFTHNGEDHINILNRMAKDKSFKGIVRNRLTSNWKELLENELGIYDIDADSMLEYFAPLERYIDKAPKEQIIKPLISRTTTPPPTTTVTTTVTTSQTTTKLTTVKVANVNKIEATMITLKPVEEKKAVDVTEGHSSKAVWIGVLIGVFSLLIIIGIVGKKKCMNRRRTTNRRFEA